MKTIRTARATASRKAIPRTSRPATPRPPADDAEALALLAVGAYTSNPLAYATEQFLGAALTADLDLSDAGHQAAEHLELLTARALDLGVLARLEIFRRSIEEAGRPGTDLATALDLILKHVLKEVQPRG